MKNIELTMPKRISFAGIDERTDVNQLIDLTALGKSLGIDIEFGVLLSGHNGEDGYNRFPSIETVRRFAGKNLNLSVHLCGKHTAEPVKNGTFTELAALLGDELFSAFQRIQLNVVDRQKKAAAFNISGKELIVQTNLNNEKSKQLFEFLSARNDKNVVFLSDTSGGRGQSGVYQCYATPWQGYAGGINPDNVAEVIRSINAEIRCSGTDQQFWLDLESGCRDDDWFSTAKCRELIENVAHMRDELEET